MMVIATLRIIFTYCFPLKDLKVAYKEKIESALFFNFL